MDWFQPTGFTIALADYTERPQVSQVGFYASPGHETRVSITASITNTTQKAIGKSKMEFLKPQKCRTGSLSDRISPRF